MDADVKIRRRLERVLKDANKEGLTVFANFSGCLMIVPTEEYEASDDLRELEGETVDLDMCGTPEGNRDAVYGTG